MLLQRFPLGYQVADLPHQGLMAIDDLLRAFPVIVEASAGHPGFELFDQRFPFGNPTLEVGNPLLKGLCLAVLLAALGFLLLASFSVSSLLSAVSGRRLGDLGTWLFGSWVFGSWKSTRF